jgi:hypothetical protein
VPDPTTEDLVAEAFFYGFPLVFNLEQVERSLATGIGTLPAAPPNAFAHATALAGPADTFVSVNNDTVYSIAQVDAGGGPVRLDVPDADGRYYVLQFVDAWTNNFAYVGHRATGTDAGSFLLVPPGWEGEEPDGVTVIRLPTTAVSIVGRWAVADDDDLPAVAALQAGLALTPTGPGAGLPAPDPRVDDELAFFERLRVAMAAFPPAERDLPVQERLRPLGLLEPESPYVDPDPALAEALRTGLTRNRQAMEAALHSDPTPAVNGWKLTYHLFDYNLDFFEVGTLDEVAWKIEDPKLRYIQRALAARAGLWGNHGYEAAYAMVYEDIDGEALRGEHVYRLRFDTLPPVGAFWSVTMYDIPDFFLVENAIDRYSIGDRTPGLAYAADGSLTITMSRDAPEDPATRANWLPAPEGPFRPVLRLYEPDESIFDGRYILPPVTRVDDPAA